MATTYRRETVSPRRQSPWLLVGTLLLAYLVTVVSVYATASWGFDLAVTPAAYLAIGIVTYLVTALVVYGYLRASGEGWAFLDVRVPTGRDLVAIVGGLLAVVVVSVAGEVAVTSLGLPVAPNVALEPVLSGALAGQRVLVLALIPIMFVLIAPVEELLYRNVVQKRLAEWVSPAGAIVLASAVFAVAHVPAYSGGSTLALAVACTLTFVTSLVFGWLYHRTGSIVVPAVVHGGLNAMSLGLLYLTL